MLFSWIKRQSRSREAEIGRLKSRINTVERVGGGLIKKVAGPDFERFGIRFNASDLIAREVSFLKSLEFSRYFPKVMTARHGYFEMIDCGEVIAPHTVPTDWRTQIDEIIADLDSAGIIHRDIKAQNLLFNGEHLVLIDFGWAVHKDENFFSCPQELCGSISRELIYDNRKALYHTIQTIQESV